MSSTSSSLFNADKFHHPNKRDRLGFFNPAGSLSPALFLSLFFVTLITLFLFYSPNPLIKANNLKLHNPTRIPQKGISRICPFLHKHIDCWRFFFFQMIKIAIFRGDAGFLIDEVLNTQTRAARRFLTRRTVSAMEEGTRVSWIGGGNLTDASCRCSMGGSFCRWLEGRQWRLLEILWPGTIWSPCFVSCLRSDRSPE